MNQYKEYTMDIRYDMVYNLNNIGKPHHPEFIKQFREWLTKCRKTSLLRPDEITRIMEGLNSVVVPEEWKVLLYGVTRYTNCSYDSDRVWDELACLTNRAIRRMVVADDELLDATKI